MILFSGPFFEVFDAPFEVLIFVGPIGFADVGEAAALGAVLDGAVERAGKGVWNLKSRICNLKSLAFFPQIAD